MSETQHLTPSTRRITNNVAACPYPYSSILVIFSFSTSCSVHADEAQELVARRKILLEAAEDAAGDGSRAGLLNAAHHHAQVARLHDDSDALRVKDLHNGVGNLLGEALLNLQPPGEHLGDARELGEPDDGIGGDVANMHLGFQ